MRGKLVAKETVLIVHGTFAAPVDGTAAWYEPGSAFCRKLDERLAAKGSAARCWAHLKECGNELQRLTGRSTSYFSWSGRNSWIDRSTAARQLLDELDYLINKGWKWHVVAHSHGGNVVLEAFDLDNPNRQGGLIANCVLLGTPILRFSSRAKKWFDLLEQFRLGMTPSVQYAGSGRVIPGREPTLLRMAIGVAVSALIWALFFRVFLNLSGIDARTLVFNSLKFWIISIGVVAALAALYWWLRHGATEAAILMTGFPAIREMMMTYPPRVLFINSERDEAFGFLSGIRSATAWREHSDPQPIRSRSTGVMAWLRNVASQAAQEDAQRYPWSGKPLGLRLAIAATVGILALPVLARLHAFWLAPFIVSWFLIALVLVTLTVPGPVFFAVAAPWRIAEAGALFCRSLVRRLVSGYARRHAWRTLQEVALGISGAPHRLDEVSVALRPDPMFARGEFLYQDVAKMAEDAAVATRSRAFYSELELIQGQSDADFWRLDKWRDRIATLASDPALVHTVYYRHPDVIEQIASHLVRSKEELYAARKEFESKTTGTNGVDDRDK